jgi:hypothetical protein
MSTMLVRGLKWLFFWSRWRAAWNYTFVRRERLMNAWLAGECRFLSNDRLRRLDRHQQRLRRLKYK